MHVVPLATLPIGTREPLLQSENEFPSLEQVICPSVQDPALPLEAGLFVVPEVEGVVLGAGGEASGDGVTAVGLDNGVEAGVDLALLDESFSETGLTEGGFEEALLDEALPDEARLDGVPLEGVPLGEAPLEDPLLEEDDDPLRNGAGLLQT